MIQSIGVCIYKLGILGFKLLWHVQVKFYLISLDERICSLGDGSKFVIEHLFSLNFFSYLLG